MPVLARYLPGETWFVLKDAGRGVWEHGHATLRDAGGSNYVQLVWTGSTDPSKWEVAAEKLQKFGLPDICPSLRQGGRTGPDVVTVAVAFLQFANEGQTPQ